MTPDPQGRESPSAEAQLVLRHDPSRRLALDRAKPTTIGKAGNNRLRLASAEGVADHHAVVRFSRSHGWLVCDWGSNEGTWLEGQRIRQCRPLSDGDEIQLGARGPVLVFQQRLSAPAAAVSPATSRPQPMAAAAEPAAAAQSAAAAQPFIAGQSAIAGQPAAAAARGPSGSGRNPRPSPLAFAGRQIPLEAIRSAHVRSRHRYPHSFSWWLLICLGGMVLLPFPWLFWPLQLAGLAGWILLGSRKEHVLIVTLRDGMAYRHRFASRITALSHRNGIRKAIGQSLEIA